MNASAAPTEDDYQGGNLILLLSPPRSGSTLLQRMIGSHSAVHTHPEPHILTPLAFQGYFHQVEQAPYNHKVAAQALREFVQDLPRQEDDYLDACRAYCRVLYGRALPPGKHYFLDKTPNYADTILPLLPRLLPKARYIVLTRHPLAILASRANTFYEGDYDQAHYARDLLSGFIPPIAEFLRTAPVPVLHVKYEELVDAPERQMRRILGFIDLPYEEQCLRFGEQAHIDKSFGDPKINRHTQPVPDSIDTWVKDFIDDKDREALVRRNLQTISDEDLRDYGYDPPMIWQPLTDGRRRGVRAAVARPLAQRLKWRLIWTLKRLAATTPVGRVLRKVIRLCQALLR
jgi:hypothetical protein